MCQLPSATSSHQTVLLPAVQPPPLKCDMKVSGGTIVLPSPHNQNTQAQSPADIDSASRRPIAPAEPAMRLRPARINRPPAIVAWTRQGCHTKSPWPRLRPAPCPKFQSRPCLSVPGLRRRTMRLNRRRAGGQTQGTTHRVGRRQQGEGYKRGGTLRQEVRCQFVRFPCPTSTQAPSTA